MRLRSVAWLLAGLCGLASARPCVETRFPPEAGRSLHAVLDGLARADRFDLNYEPLQDATISHAGGSSREIVADLANRFNLIVQYRRDAGCERLVIDRLWVLTVAKPRPVAIAAPPAPPAPDPAISKFLTGHGAKP